MYDLEGALAVVCSLNKNWKIVGRVLSRDGKLIFGNIGLVPWLKILVTWYSAVTATIFDHTYLVPISIPYAKFSHDYHV